MPMLMMLCSSFSDSNTRGVTVDTTLFTKKHNNDIFICQVYVDDIIFGSTNDCHCKEFGELMSKEFEMSMIGELTFFLGFQGKQMKDGNFLS
jgi:hypothetical protein